MPVYIEPQRLNHEHASDLHDERRPRNTADQVPGPAPGGYDIFHFSSFRCCSSSHLNMVFKLTSWDWFWPQIWAWQCYYLSYLNMSFIPAARLRRPHSRSVQFFLWRYQGIPKEVQNSLGFAWHPSPALENSRAPGWPHRNDQCILWAEWGLVLAR